MRPIKGISFITLTVIGLSFLASSCVKESDFDSRVNEIVAAQLDSLNKQVAALEKTQAALNDSLKNVKGDIEKLSEQSKSLTDSIATVKAALAAQREWTEAQLNAIGEKLDAIEEAQEAFKTEVLSRLDRLESRIQKIDLIPEHSDGRVELSVGDSNVVSFIVRPAAVADSIVRGYKKTDTTFRFLARTVLTKATVAFDTLEITKVSYAAGIVSVSVSGKKLQDKPYTACLVISDGNSETTSGFFPLKPIIYPEASNSACVKIGSTWWAPVNCGYDVTNYKYGKLYQWGRKYGQGYNKDADVDGDYPGKSGGKQTVVDITSGALTSHPDADAYNGKFYVSQDNWYGGTSPAADKLWNSNEGTSDPVSKTAYDPCPDGWRVPTYAELNTLIDNAGEGGIGGDGWDINKNGYWFNGTISPSVNFGLFLPAAGYRDYSSGGASERGSGGFYWSSSVFNGDAWYLYFGSDRAGMVSFGRANGFPVRCVQE